MSHVPNLDEMDPLDLEWFHHRYGKHARKNDVKALLGKLNMTLARDLSNYARNRLNMLQAKGKRKAVYSRVCETIYNSLPKSVQWR